MPPRPTAFQDIPAPFPAGMGVQERSPYHEFVNRLQVPPAVHEDMHRVVTHTLQCLEETLRSMELIYRREQQPGLDRLLTAQEAAPFLNAPASWLYAHAADLPFTVRLGLRRVRFSERGLQRYLDQQQGRQ